MISVIYHHVMHADDEWPHVFGKPTDCYCEPEINDLGGPHRVVTHQDMSKKILPIREVRYAD